ncbi:MAG: hypothetical protein ABI232_06020, partial [Jatrophihabitantaceae bacterium]
RPVPGRGSSSPITLSVSVPADAARVSDVINFDVRIGKGGQVAAAPFVLNVGPALSSHLVPVLSGSPQLSAQPQPFTLEVGNDGAGNTNGPLTVSLPLPAGVTALVGAGGPWSCVVGIVLECTTNAMVPAGAQAPPIQLTLASTVPDQTEASSLLGMAYTATSTDALGNTGSTGALSLSRPAMIAPSLSTAATNLSATGFDLTVHNTGSAATTADPVLTEQLPAGVIATADTAGTLWGCLQNGTILTCTGKGVSIPAGGSAGPPHVSVHFPAGASGQFVLSGFGRSGQYVSTSSSAAVNWSNPSPPAPVLSTSFTLAQNPLYNGEQTTATLEVADTGSDYDKPFAFAVVLPPSTSSGTGFASSGLLGGAVAGGGTSGGLITLNPTPWLQCGLVQELFPLGGSKKTALVCAANSLPAASRADALNLPITVSNDVSGTLTFTHGIVRGATGATATDALRMAEVTVSRSINAPLTGSQDIDVPTYQLVADAGASQHHSATTPAAAGATGAAAVPQPTVVNLDASLTTDTGHPLTYGWTQTMGPAVQWKPATRGALLPGMGAQPDYPRGTVFAGLVRNKHPSAYGVRRSFTSPTITQTTTLGFRVYVTDGFSVHSADTTVTLDPLPDNPPTATIAVTDKTTDAVLVPGGPTPAAGDAMQVVVSPADLDGDQTNVTVGVLRPAELGLAPWPSPLNRFHRVVNSPQYFTFSWPSGTPQLTLQALVTDGHQNPDGTAVTTPVNASLGPDPVALGIAITGVPGSPAVEGGKVNLGTTLTNGSVGGASSAVSWKYVSGDKINDLTKTGANASFTVPAGVKTGDTVVVEADVVRGTGSDASAASTTATIALVPAPPLTVSVTGLGSLNVAPNATLKPVAVGTGGIGAITYKWSVVLGDGTLSDNTHATASYKAGANNGFDMLHVDATDTAHHTASQDVP